MATGVDVLSSDQETGPSGSNISVQCFCHECDKKFTCDKNEVDDVSIVLAVTDNQCQGNFSCYRILSAQVVIQSLSNNWKPRTIGIALNKEILSGVTYCFIICSSEQETATNPGASFIQVREVMSYVISNDFCMF